MDTTNLSNIADSNADAIPTADELPAIREQLQTLSLYLYLDTRRYGTA